MNVSIVFTWLFALLMMCPIFTYMDSGADSAPPAPVIESTVSINEGELAFEGVAIGHIAECAFDGPYAVIVETADGQQFNVIYAPGMMPCTNPNIDPNISNLVNGDRVEVFGEIIINLANSNLQR